MSLREPTSTGRERKETFVLSVVLPCYNEEEVLSLTHERIANTLGNGPDFVLEFVYVNDGSSDKTEVMLFALADEDPCVKVVSLSRNFEHQAALSFGYDLAQGTPYSFFRRGDG